MGIYTDGPPHPHCVREKALEMKSLHTGSGLHSGGRIHGHTYTVKSSCLPCQFGSFHKENVSVFDSDLLLKKIICSLWSKCFLFSEDPCQKAFVVQVSESLQMFGRGGVRGLGGQAG